MLQMGIGLLKNEPVTVGVVAGTVSFMVAVVIWALLTFVTTAEAEQSMQALSDKIDANGTLLKTHIDEYKLGGIARDIQTVRDQQYDLSVMVDQNGESALSKKRTGELRNRLADLEKKERCTAAGNAICR